jgi:hypothetical protein
MSMLADLAEIYPKPNIYSTETIHLTKVSRDLPRNLRSCDTLMIQNSLPSYLEVMQQ